MKRKIILKLLKLRKCLLNILSLTITVAIGFQDEISNYRTIHSVRALTSKGNLKIT